MEIHEKNVDYKELVIKILELSDRTAPVDLSFGYTDNNFCHKGIVIKKAAPYIMTELFKSGYSINVFQEGVRVFKNLEGDI